jgi:hypothetical protein
MPGVNPLNEAAMLAISTAVICRSSVIVIG